jgi:hypothetical protein
VGAVEKPPVWLPPGAWTLPEGRVELLPRDTPLEELQAFWLGLGVEPFASMGECWAASRLLVAERTGETVEALEERLRNFGA